MKQITKYIGMFAILPLVMVALAPNYIGDAEAKENHQVQRDVVLPDPVPDVNLTLKQVFGPQESGFSPVETTRYSSESSDSITYQVVYSVNNSGETDVKNVRISVQSDTETVDAELIKSKSGRNSSLITVFVEASDPASITAKIVGFEV